MMKYIGDQIIDTETEELVYESIPRNENPDFGSLYIGQEFYDGWGRLGIVYKFEPGANACRYRVGDEYGFGTTVGCMRIKK